MASQPVRVGLIGAGFISDQYLTNMTRYPDLRVVAVGDLFEERAKQQAETYGVARGGSPESVIDDPEVELIVNLTVPAAHGPIATQALERGKHVWNEKPLTTDLDSSSRLVELADEKGLFLGCAPDTFLGAGIQTTLRLIAEGAIGRPLTAQGIMQNPGPERWHPDPAFIFGPGVGPLFDIGPYYLTTLVQALGPVRSVSALSSIAHPVRTVRVGSKAGQEIEVQVATHTAALIQFSEGAQAQTTFSYDAELQREGFLEIIGTEGTLVAPDPNHFEGEIRILRDGRDPEVIPVPSRGTGRGVGAVDMARAIRTGSPVRATGRLGHYVLQVETAIQTAADERRVVDVDAAFTPSPLLPEDWSPTERTV
jgi:predicted dehydrogenase